MKRLFFIGIALVPGIVLSLAVSCKKNSSDSNFFKFQLPNESYSLDSIFAFADSSGPDFYSINIGGHDTKTGTYVELILFSFPKGDIGGTYVYDNPLPYPLPNPYKEFEDASVRLNEGQYNGSYNMNMIGGVAANGSTLVIESSDHQVLKGHFLSTLNPALNPGQGGAVQYLQITGQFSAPFYFRH